MELTDMLRLYYETQETKDLAQLFESYMKSIGAKRLDPKRADNANTYQIDGKSTNWNRVECTYYRENGDHLKYGRSEFCITFRKRSGRYLLLETGNQTCDIKRPYEISYGDIVHYDEKELTRLQNLHPGLFRMMEKAIS